MTSYKTGRKYLNLTDVWEADEAASKQLRNWVEELLVQTSKVKDSVQNEEAKIEEGYAGAKEEHILMEKMQKNEVEVLQA